MYIFFFFCTHMSHPDRLLDGALIASRRVECAMHSLEPGNGASVMLCFLVIHCTLCEIMSFFMLRPNPARRPIRTQSQCKDGTVCDDDDGGGSGKKFFARPSSVATAFVCVLCAAKKKRLPSDTWRTLSGRALAKLFCRGIKNSSALALAGSTIIHSNKRVFV